MTKLKQIYRCNLCGNVIEVLNVGIGELVCCGQPMGLMQEKTEDSGQEKHLPVVKITENGIKVEVGSVLHPMEKEHYIKWIEVINNGLSYKKFLNSNDKPVAEFKIKTDKIEVREFCNIHGLWKVVKS